MPISSPRIHRGLTPFFALLALAACDDSGTGPDPIEEPTFGEITLDATSDWAFVQLGDDASKVFVSDPSTATTWDIGVFATSVMLNGGDAGAAGVEGTCLCGNASLTAEEVAQLTEADGLAAFEAVTMADVPTDAEAWVGDELVPAIDEWYAYDFQTHTVSADPAAVFKVRTADGASFAKLHVTAVTNPTQQHAGTVTFEFAVQAGAGAPFGAVATLDVDVSAGPVAVDLETASTVAAGAAGWDLELSGYTIRVNGGVSGHGQAGAVVVEDDFATITDAGDLTANHYAGDAFGGVFASPDDSRKWYLYNIQGGHQIWPTYNVYVVRRGDDLYKVQMAGYYHPDTGDSRHVTVRYARLDG